MKCDCKEELEAKLLVNFTEAHPEAQDHKTGLGGYGLVMTGNTLEVLGYMPVESTFRYTTRAGALKAKTVKQSMFFSYCPFCGVKA